ncbi:MAG: 4-alpha-glucanotransferase, partial [Candidatus Omnitrophica bacterium]|nr:4-alpha-glucanotransferase [Candidatus Omnitrophota bacterium]
YTMDVIQASSSPVSFDPKYLGKGLKIYYLFLRNAARPGRNRNAFGNFSDLKYAIDHASALGYNAIFLMPLFDPASSDRTIDDSPYGLLSSYAFDPRHIDWGLTGLTGKTLIERWYQFKKNFPEDYKDIAERQEIRRYARVKTLQILKKRVPGYLIANFEELVGLSDEDIAKTKEYRIVSDLLLMEQYFARNQLIEAVQYAHERDVMIGFDYPYFRVMEGVESYFNRGIFAQDERGMIEAAGWQLENKDMPGRDWQEWGSKETQTGLAQYDWEELRKQNYKPLIDPMRYYIEDFGIDFMRLDAFHYGYGMEGYYGEVERIVKDYGTLLIPENLGALNQELVDNRCCQLGMCPIDSPTMKDWQEDSWWITLNERWQRFLRYLYDRSSLPSVWMPTHHDSLRMAEEYARLFKEDVSHDIRARVMYAVCALILPNYSMFFGDEFGEQERINEPGITHTWRQHSPYRTEKHELYEFFRELNHIRDQYGYLSEYGNILKFFAFDNGVYFERISPDKTTILQVAIDVRSGEYFVNETILDEELTDNGNELWSNANVYGRAWSMFIDGMCEWKKYSNSRQQWIIALLSRSIEDDHRDGGKRWASEFYRAYKRKYSRSITGREVISLILQRLLWSDNWSIARTGADWAISQDEFLGKVEHADIADWADDDRTVLKVLVGLEPHIAEEVLIEMYFKQFEDPDEERGYSRRQWIRSILLSAQFQGFYDTGIKYDQVKRILDQIMGGRLPTINLDRDVIGAIGLSESAQKSIINELNKRLEIDFTPLNRVRWGKGLYRALKFELWRKGDEGKTAFTKEDPFTVKVKHLMREDGKFFNLFLRVKSEGRIIEEVSLRDDERVSRKSGMYAGYKYCVDPGMASNDMKIELVLKTEDYTRELVLMNRVYKEIEKIKPRSVSDRPFDYVPQEFLRDKWVAVL